MDGSFLLLPVFFVLELIVLQVKVKGQGIWCWKFALHPLRRDCTLWPLGCLFREMCKKGLIIVLYSKALLVTVSIGLL